MAAEPLPCPREMAVVAADGPDALTPGLLRSPVPLLLRGLVARWPAVQAGLASPEAAAEYLQRFYSGQPLTAYLAAPEAQGRFFYDETCTGFNFRSGTATLGQVLGHITAHAGEAQAPSIYVGSTMLDRWFPGFTAENDLGIARLQALASVWIGNRTRVSAHYDFPSNIACNVMGRRRFTVFPPEALPDLYFGPLDVTPSGQSISLVDFAAPDLERHPRFAKALAVAQVAELEPGDAIYLPSMWIHHVEALADLNVLVNYWWCESPPWMGAPSNALQHALLSIRDLPPEQRRVWKALFDHYVFEPDPALTAHIPEAGRGVLGPLTAESARKVRNYLMNRLNQ
jgi:Cupin-like domain